LRLLYGLEGAIQDIPKRELSERRKAELRDFFKQLN
ncbi:TfoX/Sxy family protein, partial [Enterococcus sp. S181_ASV_20]|nr:TfoX/Sxy family protein [Enterococcus sp. S181_ASV_20]